MLGCASFASFLLSGEEGEENLQEEGNVYAIFGGFN